MILFFFREFVLADFKPDYLFSVLMSQMKIRELHACTPSALCSLLFVLGETASERKAVDCALLFWNKRYSKREGKNDASPKRYFGQMKCIIGHVSELLCQPKRLLLRSDICAGSLHDQRWKEVFQSEFQKEHSEMSIDSSTEPICKVNENDDQDHETVKDALNKDAFQTIGVDEHETSTCLRGKGMSYVSKSMKKWVTVPQWNNDSSPRKPYHTKGERPTTLLVNLDKKGSEYLNSTDICLLARALYRLKNVAHPTTSSITSSLAPGPNSQSVSSWTTVLLELERWLQSHPDELEPSQVSTLIYSLAEVGPQLESTKTILSTLLKDVSWMFERLLLIFAAVDDLDNDALMRISIV